MEEPKQEYDLDKVYDFKEYPDIKSGRCDNCDHTLFESSVKKFIFLRKCRNCGMTKRI